MLIEKQEHLKKLQRNKEWRKYFFINTLPSTIFCRHLQTNNSHSCGLIKIFLGLLYVGLRSEYVKLFSTQLLDTLVSYIIF